MRRAAALLVALAAGCAVQPDYRRPELELPQAWQESAPRPERDEPWWRVYGDPALDRLIEEALASNTDVLVAAARVEEARAVLGEVDSARQPQVDVNAAAGRSLYSTATGLLPPGLERERSDYRATLDVYYELDIFGRLRAASDAARAELAAGEAVRDAVRLALTARVAGGYYGLLSLDAQVELTQRAIAIREDSLALQRRRRAAGLISDFDLRQLEAETATLRAELPPLERDRELEEAALAALLGRSPRAVFEEVLPRTAPATDAVPVAVPAGMPSELLLRRPDLLEAEQRLVAANARVAQARADYFPSISLTGFLGSASAELGDLFTGPAGIWGVAAALAQPIYTGGRLDAQRDAALARERAALAEYQGAVRNAFREVRQALSAQARARESVEAQAARVEALRETLRLARLRYSSGLASQLEVLDAERSLLDAHTARIRALRQQRTAVADLYRALGG
jgi:multidrug efflux system outer membrane protein